MNRAASFRILLTFAIAFLAGHMAQGATKTWDTVQGDGATITGGSGNWSNGGMNWNTGAGDSTWSNAAPDSAVFSTGSGTVTLTSAITASNITFNSGTNYTLTGNTISLQNGADPYILANESATINSNITLVPAQTWSVASAKTLTLGGTVNASVANTNFGLSGNGGYLFNGAIGGNVRDVLFNGGSATGTFTQTNSFTGRLWLGNGGTNNTLNFSDVNQLGTGTAGGGGNNGFIALQNGATLRYTGAGSQTVGPRWLFWNLGSAEIEITQASANLTFDITGGGLIAPFTKDGAGQLTLSKSTAINEVTSNPVLITGGILEYNQSNANAIYRFASTVTGSAGTQIKVSGTGYIGNDFLTANWGANLADLDIGSTASFDLRGQGITIDALTGSGAMANSFNNGTNTLTATLVVGANGGSGTFSGVIKQTAPTGFPTSNSPVTALTKTGAGTQTLSGANTYTGVTNVSQGKLLVNGTHTGLGLYTVASGATLGGSGDIDAAVLLQGAISPGNSPGTLTTGSQTWTNSGSYVFEINDATGTAGSSPGWDLLVINNGGGTASLDLSGLTLGGFDVNIVSLTPPSPPDNAGDIVNFNKMSNYAWRFVDADVTIGSFASNLFNILDNFTNDTSAGVPGYFQVLRGDNPLIGGSNTDLYIYYTAAVPEPSTYALGLFGLAGLGLLAWRKRFGI